ncbi:sulfite exporter TauE/SafE family protein [Georgenia sp. M64]|uniref:sulfite exporter TauE/SafE family protein n=1 Tax=Georgenia sp. M64 TaxID=3120520 RepID=UPI0030DE754E
MTEVLLPAAIGLAVGVVVGALGGGGGILTVPILVYLLGTAPYGAATASMVIVGATSAVALVSHARAGNVRWGPGLTFGLLGAVWAFLGSRLSAGADPAVLMTAFSMLLTLVAVLMLRKALARSGEDATPAGPAALDAEPEASSDDADLAPGPDVARHAELLDPRRRTRLRRAGLVVAAASLVGLLTGFFGVGGGFAVVPALVLALGLPMRHAVGTSLLVIVVNSLTGLAGRTESLPTVDWATVVAFAAASMAGGFAGSRLSARTPPHRLTTAFAVLLAVVAVATATQAVPDLLR